jgi:hypothetical protein
MTWLTERTVVFAPLPVYDEADFHPSRIFDGVEYTTQQSLDTGQDDTLYKNCNFHDIVGNGLQMRNVDNVVVHNCTFTDISIHGIFLRKTGSTSNVTIDNCTILRTGENGIHATQDFTGPVDHTNFKILRCDISDTGEDFSAGSKHGLYVQCGDFLIRENKIHGNRDGNGISVRSSGVIRFNDVSGVSKDGKPCIRYFSDHFVGSSNLLDIYGNYCRGPHDGIHINQPTTLAETGGSPPTHVVKNFNIENNTTLVAGTGIAWHTDYDSSPYTVTSTNNN